MRKFIDSHLKPRSDSELESMLRVSKETGFKAIAMSSFNLDLLKAKKLCDELGIDIVSRIDLKPKSESELTASLSRYRRRFELICVECLSKAVARKAVRDHRVDMLCFSPSLQTRSQVWFDRQAAALAKESNCSYEINAVPLLSLGPVLAARLIAIVMNEVQNALKSGVKVVLSSGAETRFQLRDPLGLASLTDLYGMNEETGLDTISTNPWKIIEKNRLKLDPGFIEPGVRLARNHAS